MDKYLGVRFMAEYGLRNWRQKWIEYSARLFLCPCFCQCVIVTMMVVSLNACLVGPDFKQPRPPTVTHYTEQPDPYRTVSVSGTAGASQYFIKTAPVPTQWWRLFHSRKLNTLVCRGLANSPNLTAAKAVLLKARENFNAGVAGFSPAFTAAFSAQRGSASGFFNTNTTNNTVTGHSGTAESVFNLFNASVNVAYIFDIFGGIRREIEALQSQVSYQYFELKAASISLAANIVTSTMAMASLQTQLNVTRELLGEQKEELRIVKQQFQLGGASGADVLAQEIQVAQTGASLLPLEKSREQTRHVLAMLVGSFPSAHLIPNFDLGEFDLPTRLPLSIPSSLVRHRPDVRAAEALWAVANAQVGVATANLYPQLTITGNYGDSNAIGSQLFSSQSKLWGIGGALLQPLFKGGALRAQRRAALAAYDQAKAQYQQVVLQAFQNVADVLRALEIDARELRAQKQAELASHASLWLTRQQFVLGGVSYLALLDAQRRYQKIRISLIQAQAIRYADTAALYQALGGGEWHV